MLTRHDFDLFEIILTADDSHSPPVSFRCVYQPLGLVQQAPISILDRITQNRSFHGGKTKLIPQQIAGTHSYTQVEGGEVSVKPLSQ